MNEVVRHEIVTYIKNPCEPQWDLWLITGIHYVYLYITNPDRLNMLIHICVEVENSGSQCVMGHWLVRQWITMNPAPDCETWAYILV